MDGLQILTCHLHDSLFGKTEAQSVWFCFTVITTVSTFFRLWWLHLKQLEYWWRVAAVVWWNALPQRLPVQTSLSPLTFPLILPRRRSCMYQLILLRWKNPLLFPPSSSVSVFLPPLSEPSQYSFINKPHQSTATTKPPQSSETIHIMLCCTSDTTQPRPGGEDSDTFSPAKRFPDTWRRVCLRPRNLNSRP